MTGTLITWLLAQTKMNHLFRPMTRSPIIANMDLTLVWLKNKWLRDVFIVIYSSGLHALIINLYLNYFYGGSQYIHTDYNYSLCSSTMESNVLSSLFMSYLYSNARSIRLSSIYLYFNAVFIQPSVLNVPLTISDCCLSSSCISSMMHSSLVFHSVYYSYSLFLFVGDLLIGYICFLYFLLILYNFQSFLHASSWLIFVG